MQCSREEFFSILESWRGKLCLTLLTSKQAEGRFFLRVEDVSSDFSVHFVGAEGTELDIDLEEADNFEFADYRSAPGEVREMIQNNFESAIGARVTGEFALRLMLARNP